MSVCMSELFLCKALAKDYPRVTLTVAWFVWSAWFSALSYRVKMSRYQYTFFNFNFFPFFCLCFLLRLHFHIILIVFIFLLIHNSYSNNIISLWALVKYCLIKYYFGLTSSFQSLFGALPISKVYRSWWFCSISDFYRHIWCESEGKGPIKPGNSDLQPWSKQVMFWFQVS